MRAFPTLFSRAFGPSVSAQDHVIAVGETNVEKPQSQFELRDVMERVSEVAEQLQQQINNLGNQVETRFKNNEQFQCKGHEKVIGHFHIEKKAHKRGAQEAARLESGVENRRVTYKVIHKDSPEYKKYSEDLNFFERRMHFQYVAVVTQYHHNNKIGCSHYTEWLKSKDITQY